MKNCSIEAHGENPPKAVATVIDSNGELYLFLCACCKEAFEEGQDTFDLILIAESTEQPPKIYYKPTVDVMEIDDLLDEGYSEKSFVGKKLIYHDDKEYPLMVVAGRLVAAIDQSCENCGSNPATFFHGSGLHNGAWCYAFGFDGELKANFRDQIYMCEPCGDLQAVDKRP